MERKLRMGSALLILYFSVLLISVSPVTAQRRRGGRYGGDEEYRRDERSSACRRLQRLSAHEPSESESLRSEGGSFELSNPEDNEELECVGVAFFRKTIERGARSLPQYPNAPLLLYVHRGTYANTSPTPSFLYLTCFPEIVIIIAAIYVHVQVRAD